jgi:hypothetical protein
MALAKVGYALKILFFFLEVSFGVGLDTWRKNKLPTRAKV